MPAASVSDLQMLQVAYNRARRLGLTREDSQDCAQEFRVHFLRTPVPDGASTAWLNRCAHNYACNYLRSMVRRKSTEQKYTDQIVGSKHCRAGAEVYFPGPRTLTLRKVFWDQLLLTLRHFTPEQQSLFLRYHIRQHSMTDISLQTGRTVHALQQSLSHMHRRLSRLLLEQGWNLAEIRQLFGSSSQQSTAAARIHN